MYVRVGPDTFLAGYRIPDIRLISNAGYPVTGRISGQRRISGKYPVIRPNYRISGRITGQITTYKSIKKGYSPFRGNAP